MKWIRDNAGGVISVLLVVVSMQSVVLVHSELSTHRTSQDLCLLVTEKHADQQRRYDQTKVYLASPVGRAHTGLNDYIRNVSLPQTRAELIAEQGRLPKC